MTTNDLKKGTRVKLSNGWDATLLDNRKGKIRLAEVEGIVTECGSIYASDIIGYYDANNIFYSLNFKASMESASKLRLEDLLISLRQEGFVV